MSNKNPHARKKGPGRYHVDGHKTPKPVRRGKRGLRPARKW